MINPEEGTHQYYYGTEVSLTTEAETGYRFEEWTGSCVDSGLVVDPRIAATTVRIEADCELVANFTNLPTPTIQFTSAGSSGSESQSAASFALSLSAESVLSISVDYVITGTATGNDEDYILTEGTVILNPGNLTVP